MTLINQVYLLVPPINFMHHLFLFVCLFALLYGSAFISESVGQNVAKLLNFGLPSPIPVAARSEA